MSHFSWKERKENYGNSNYKHWKERHRHAKHILHVQILFCTTVLRCKLTRDTCTMAQVFSTCQSAVTQMFTCCLSVIKQFTMHVCTCVPTNLPHCVCTRGLFVQWRYVAHIRHEQQQEIKDYGDDFCAEQGCHQI